MANMATRISIYADDKASASFRRVGGEADSLAKKIDALNALGPGLRNVFAGLGVSVGFAEAIRQAAAFETALVSMRRVTSRSASELKADIAGLGPELGSQTQLMQGLYTVYSSGVTEAAKAVDLLTTASKASKVSGVSQAQAVDALTSLMTGYTGELNRAAEASDLLFAIEKQGKTTVGEVIPVIGELAGVSKQAGISADEMGAQFSALTLTSGGRRRPRSTRPRSWSCCGPTKSWPGSLGVWDTSPEQRWSSKTALPGRGGCSTRRPGSPALRWRSSSAPKSRLWGWPRNLKRPLPSTPPISTP